ncbi:MAG: alpha-glucosidase [Cyanobacteria bacterium SZAS-4]|nr:alpha-glucosidase [Cyanobacteria bacterium SZAS-4]
MKPIELAADWESARKLPSRIESKRQKNIFAGESITERAVFLGVEVLRVSTWPKGHVAPPHSYAVVHSASAGQVEEQNSLHEEEPWPDDMDDDLDGPDRRVEQSDADFAKEFADVSDDGRFTDAAGASLPLNLEWQQTSESCWQFFFDLAPGARCLGLGERNSSLNLRSSSHTLFNTDNHLHIESMDSMYKSIPFLIVEHGEEFIGLFLDSPARQRWDLDTELTNQASVELLSRRGWQLYCIGPSSLPNVVKTFTALTGRSKLPPLWATGHQQCRWSYPDQETVVRIAHEFRQRQIPCDGIVLDIDYMDEYRVFTFSKERFPDFKDLIADLNRNNFKVTAIIDPGVKKDSKFFVFTDGKKHDYFCKKSDDKLFIGEVWPGQSVFPDFLKPDVRMWWAAQHGFHTENGIAGIWNDMNEPAIFKNQEPLDWSAHELPKDEDQLFMQETPEGKLGHYEVRNLYGSMMSRSSYEGMLALRPNQRPFILTRSGYAGVQRYAAVWLGDNMSWWHHLARSIPMLLNMGLSGVAFSGVDIGGFGHNCSGELLTRWYALGLFYPYFRNHCWMKGDSQEPWAFGPTVEAHCRKFIETRYRLLPYIYSLFWESSRSGAPLMRPLAWHYPEDQFAREVDDQFLFGEQLLVAPIIERGRTWRSVYLPEGLWHPFEGGEPLEGGQVHKVQWGLDAIPVFVKDGSVIPMCDVMQSTAEYAQSPITFQCFGKSAKGIFIEDDGSTFDYEDGFYNEWRLKVDEGKFVAQPVELGFDSPRRNFSLLYDGKLESISLSIS